MIPAGLLAALNSPLMGHEPPKLHLSIQPVLMSHSLTALSFGALKLRRAIGEQIERGKKKLPEKWDNHERVSVEAKIGKQNKCFRSPSANSQLQETALSAASLCTLPKWGAQRIL